MVYFEIIIYNVQRGFVSLCALPKTTNEGIAQTSVIVTEIVFLNF